MLQQHSNLSNQYGGNDGNNASLPRSSQIAGKKKEFIIDSN